MASIGIFEKTVTELQQCYDYLNDDLYEKEHNYRNLLIDMCVNILENQGYMVIEAENINE